MGTSVLFDYTTDYRRTFDIIKQLPSFSLCYLYFVRLTLNYDVHSFLLARLFCADAVKWAKLLRLKCFEGIIAVEYHNLCNFSLRCFIAFNDHRAM